MSDHCDHCPVPGSPCLLRERGQCHHAAREATAKARRPGAETPYTDRAIARASRANPYARPDAGGRIRVAFLGPTLASHGGTETWHATLIPRLDPARFVVLGYGVTSHHHFGPEFARRIEASCPVAVGLEPCQQLCRAAAIVVAWGISDLAPFVGRADSPWHVRTVAVSHGDDHLAWTSSILAAANPHVDHYVAVSAAALAPIPAARRPDAVVIRNAVEPERLTLHWDRATVRAAFNLPPDAPIILFCGRLSSEKRPEIAVEAVARLPGVHLVFAGDGFERADLEHRAAPIADRVHFLGAVAAVADLMAAADLLVSPSESEGFGLSVAEAMWCGLPVVGTPTGILADRPELARLVPRGGDAAAWAATLRSELDDERSRTARANHAWAFARSEFHPDRFAAQWGDHLASLVGRVPAAPSGSPPDRLQWDRAANARLCPHRQLIPPEERQGCGCAHRCLAGRSRQRDGGVTVLDCWDCDLSPRRVGLAASLP